MIIESGENVVSEQQNGSDSPSVLSPKKKNSDSTFSTAMSPKLTSAANEIYQQPLLPARALSPPPRSSSPPKTNASVPVAAVSESLKTPKSPEGKAISVSSSPKSKAAPVPSSQGLGTPLPKIDTSIASASSAGPQSTKKRGTLVREQLKFCSTILKALRKHRDAYPFLAPVDPVALKIPDYFDVIKKPMDLSTIQSKLERVAYEDADEFIADIRQMLENCYIYNGHESPISVLAKNVEKAFENLLARMPSESSMYNNINNTINNNNNNGPMSPNDFPTTPMSATSAKGAARTPSASSSVKRQRNRASGTPGASSNVKKNTVAEQMKFCSSVLKELTKPSYNTFAWPFMQPVDPEALGIPDYFNVIKHPMDLSTVQKKLESNVYRSCEEFKADIDLMFDNCYIFNPPDSDVVLMAKKLQNIFRAKYARKPTFVDAKTFASSVGKVSNSMSSSSLASAAAMDDDDISEEEEEQIRKIQVELQDLQSKLSSLLERKRNRKMQRKRSSGLEAVSPRSTKKAKTSGKPSTSSFPSPSPAALTYEEKKKLSEDIAGLTEQQQGRVLQIIQDSMPKIAEQGQEEIELDIEMLDIKTLLALQKYVNEVQGGGKSRSLSSKKGSGAASKASSALPPTNVRYDSDESSSDESDFMVSEEVSESKGYNQARNNGVRKSTNHSANRKKMTANPVITSSSVLEFGVVDKSILQNTHARATSTLSSASASTASASKVAVKEVENAPATTATTAITTTSSSLIKPSNQHLTTAPVLVNPDSWNNMMTSPTINSSHNDKEKSFTDSSSHLNNTPSKNSTITGISNGNSDISGAWSNFQSHALNQKEREQALAQMEQERSALIREKELEAERKIAALKAQEEADLLERKRKARLELLKETESFSNY